MTPKPHIISKEVKELLRDSAHEFLWFISLEANTQCELEKKKTISNQHLYAALKAKGFDEFILGCESVSKNYEDYSKHKPSKQNKFKESGKTMEELEEIQKNLFADAAKKHQDFYNVESDDIE